MTSPGYEPTTRDEDALRATVEMITGRSVASVVFRKRPDGFQPCADAPFGTVTNCYAMDCEGQGCALTAARATPPGSVSLDDLRLVEPGAGQPISDHPYRPDRQGQWVTGRCDKCGEPKRAHDERGMRS